MATVQQLEKLHYIQRQFNIDDSLESAVAAERLARAIEKTEQLIRQRAFLRDERRRLRIAAQEVELKEKSLVQVRRTDWLPPSITGPPERHVRINIGGLMFEAKVSVLVRDPTSVLAQLCSDEPPVPIQPEGFYFFDRDWWLFRFILTFLRDGTLPDDRGLLAQLYRESSFWNLKQIQLAIEEQKLHLRAPSADEKPENAPWWRKVPSWWQAIEEEENKKKAKEEADKKAVKKEDWWADTKYKGVVYLPIPKISEEKKAEEKEELKQVTRSTWRTFDKAAVEREYYY